MNSPSTNPAGTGSRLALIERARQNVLQERNPGAPQGLAPWIERSWRRCLDRGLEPNQHVAFNAVFANEMHQALEASQQLLRAAEPVLRSLTRAMAKTRYFAILTDARGTVIDVNGPVDRHNPLAAVIARVGVDLSEHAVGTTAIGASLAELEPVWLHRGEHFYQDTSVYSCAGAPIWGPDGQCLGMLDLTGIDVPEQPALKHLVTQSARSIENALTLQQPHRLLLRLNWPGRVLGDDSDGLVCVDDDGLITGLNRPAADMLGVRPGLAAGHCSDIFAVASDSLFDAAHSNKPPFETPLWTGLNLQVQAQLHDGQMQHASTGHHLPLRTLETALIRKAVDDARGNVMEAARALGISRATVYRKLGSRRGPGQ